MPLNETAVERVQAFLLRETGGKPLTSQQRRAARIALTREAERLAPRAGRTAAITEADMTLGRITRADGTVKPPKAARKAAKAAKAARVAQEALIQRKITEALAARGIGGPSRAITETVSGASQSPGPARPLEEYSAGELHCALLASNAAMTNSPTWRRLASGLDVPTLPTGQASAPPPDAPLDALSNEQFRDRARQGFAAHSKATGFGSPVWQED
jgi:hypothetical protein